MRRIALLLPLALAGCFGMAPGSLPPCAKPVSLPHGWLSDKQVTDYWIQDRQALLNCGDKVEVLSGRKAKP